ncbi:Rrf2 family transcriptional regulator [Providencia rettgeri]|nr:Rrf2 family transcriptional regulator [Providencia rettgeri]
MKVTVIDEQNTDIRWEFRQEPKSGRMAVKWLKDGTQEQIVTALEQALKEAKNQYAMVGLQESDS